MGAFEGGIYLELSWPGSHVLRGILIELAKHAGLHIGLESLKSLVLL